MNKILLLSFFYLSFTICYAQTDTKIQYEYISFSTFFNQDGEEKFKGTEEVVQVAARAMNKESKPVDKDLYYAKTAEKTLEILGKNGFELVTVVAIKLNEGNQLRFYLKKRIDLN